MSWRCSAPLIIAALIACGDNRPGGPPDDVDADVGGAADAAPADAGVDAAPADAGIDAALADAAPACGDGHLDPGEECDQSIAGLSGDGCSSTCTTELITWTNLTPNPAPPRWRHAMAYDSVRHRLVLFGGRSGIYDSTPSNETWEWDGTTWTRVLTLVNPPARSLHTMAYDSARQRVVMFGGAGATAMLGDTWEWDGSTWTQPITPMAPAPTPTDTAHMAYDPVRKVMVLAGESTWEYDGTTWNKRSDTGPAPLSFTDLVYAGAAGVMLIGGHQNFFWDGSTWTAVSFAAQVPWTGGPVFAAHDDVNDRVLAVGYPGSDRDGLGVWEWANGDWVRRQPTQAGGPRELHVDVAFDRDRGVLTLFGGATTPFVSAQTWDWDGARWRDRYLSVPPPRILSQVAYDARRGRVVMFGGNGRGALLGDTWEWDGTSWTARSTAVAPTPRVGAGMAYDEARGVVVLHGGNGQTFDAAGASQGLPLGDTWEWDGSSWELRSTASLPELVGKSAMTFDRAHGYILLFDAGQTWTWSGTTWSHHPTAHAPSDATSLVFDARRGVPVLYTRNEVIGHRVWEWDGLDWIDRGSAPSGHALLYDPNLARSVLFYAAGLGATGSMFMWDGTTWSGPTAWGGAPFTVPRVYDRATRSWFNFDDPISWDTWLGQLGASDPRERCDGSDADADGLTRCADPDCWWRCTPLCASGELGCAPNAPRCGDGTCSALEDAALCPADCL